MNEILSKGYLIVFRLYGVDVLLGIVLWFLIYIFVVL